jgi:hypothetical protein
MWIDVSFRPFYRNGNNLISNVSGNDMILRKRNVQGSPKNRLSGDAPSILEVHFKDAFECVSAFAGYLKKTSVKSAIYLKKKLSTRLRMDKEKHL